MVFHQMDLHGIMPSYQNHCWILTIIDIMSKYFIAVPLYDSSATEVAEALVNHVITKYGPPKSPRIKAPNFVIRLFKASQGFLSCELTVLARFILRVKAA